MNIAIILLIIFEGSIGIISTIYIIISLFGTLGYKIYRKIKHGTPLFN